MRTVEQGHLFDAQGNPTAGADLCHCGEPADTGPHGTECPGAEAVLGGYLCTSPTDDDGCGKLFARLPGEMCDDCAEDMELD